MLSFFIGLVSALLTGLGVGSGGLLVLYLTAFTSIPQLSAQMINLMFFVLSALSATLWNIKNNRVEPLLFCLLTVFSIFGILPGVFLSMYLPQTILRKCFGGLMVFMGLWGFVKKKK